jgi:hypothetical protein
MPSVANALEAGAAKRFVEIVAPNVGPNKTRFGRMAQKVAPQLTENPELTSWTRTGLHAKVKTGLANAEAMLDEAANARAADQVFPTQPIIEDLLTKRKALTAEVPSGTPAEVGKDVVPAPNQTRVAQIDGAIAEMQQLGPQAGYETIRRIRQAYDIPAKAVYSPSVTADFLKAQGGKLGAADVTGVLRDHLARIDPATAAANAEYSLYRTVDDVLNATAEVERVRPKVGRQIMAKLTGAMVGERAAGIPGAVVGYVFAPAVDAALSAGWTTKLQTAALMTKLATAIRTGDVGRVASLTTQVKAIGAQAATLIGRSTNPSESQTSLGPSLLPVR